jgi:hypothetical protein
MNVIKIYKRENVELGLKIIHSHIWIPRLKRASKAQCNGFLKIRDSKAKSLSPCSQKKKRIVHLLTLLLFFKVLRNLISLFH